jgi:hypothetical protein
MQGERGAPGVNPANPVWVDSQGRVLGSDALYFDDAGVLWQIDLETGTPSTYTPPIYFSQPSCTGNAWISTVLPRQAVNVDGGWFVRADDALRENVLSNSYILEGNCYPANMSPGKGVSSMSFRPVTAPALPFVGPMHRELR